MSGWTAEHAVNGGNAWKSPTGGSPEKPTVLFRCLAHMHSAAISTIKCILRILVCETFWHKCQQATALPSVLPCKVCWITWRKPEVWAQSARHPSQRHSSAHPVISEHHTPTPANPTACTEHTAYRIQIDMSQERVKSMSFMTMFPGA